MFTCEVSLCILVTHYYVIRNDRQEGVIEIVTYQGLPTVRADIMDHRLYGLYSEEGGT